MSVEQVPPPTIAGLLSKLTRRFKKKVKYLANLRSFFWECESCMDCGHCFRIAWTIKDEVWMSVMPDDGGCLCLDCFIERAEQKGIQIMASDFDWLAIFSTLGSDDIIGAPDGPRS